MPTSDTQIRDAFRRVYGQMIDDRAFAPEWAHISAVPAASEPAQPRPRAWMAAVAAAVLIVVAIGGVAWLAGTRSGDDTIMPGVELPTTTAPAPVARMTVVFTPGELTSAQWDEFTTVLGSYPSAGGYAPVDETTARQQAVALFADEPNAPDVLDEYPFIAAGYAHVDFADLAEAVAFQEDVTGLDFVVTAIGANGPRLGRGYAALPELPLGSDNVRGLFWQHIYQTGLPPEMQSAEPNVTTTVVDVPASCPFTVSGDDAFAPASEAPDDPPEVYSDVWYGTPDLWTLIDPSGEVWADLPINPDGTLTERTFWWSENYSPDDPREVTVIAEQLDGTAPPFEASQTAGSGFSPFMTVTTHESVTMVGLDLPNSGCWRLIAHYKGATLSYVVWVAAN